MKLNFKDNEFNEYIRLTLLAVLVGFVAGLASIVFKIMIHFFQSQFWKGTSIISTVSSQPWYITVIIPALGAVIISPFIYYGAREAKGHGVPEIMEALVFRGGRIHTKVAAVKALASSICIASGGSVGREGPIVQISSTIASSLGRLFHTNERGLRTLVAAGAGAGIGATFNAPIAGSLFAVEILLGEFGIFSFSPVIIASVIATFTSRSITGDFSAFDVPAYTLSSIYEIGPYILLGIMSGLIAIIFIKSIYFFEDKFDSLRIHPLVKPVMGGLMVGLLGLGLPQILGLGYDSIDICLKTQTGILLALLLVFAKIISTSLTLGSGGSGGIFAPSLFIGAMSGNFVGSIFHSVFPNSISSPGGFSLVGMGAVAAAATHAPITAIIIIFELTNDYKIILPLMLSCIISSFMAAGLQKESIYTMKLKRRGILFKEGREMNILRALSVKDFISQDYQVFLNAEHVGNIINLAIGGKHHSFQIVDPENNYVGCFPLNQLKKLMLEKDLLASFVIAQDLAVQAINLDYKDNLEQAMKIFGHEDVAEIAILKDKKLIGVVKRKDVIEAYNHEILKREAAEGLVQKLKFTQSTKSFDITAGYKIMEIDAPSTFCGKSLKELNLKALYHIDILFIKRKYPPQSIPIPSANEIIKEGDRLIVAGLSDNLTKIIQKGL